MKCRLLTSSPAAFSVVLVLTSGCASGEFARPARLAEREGEFHTAYDLYCRAAQSSPDSGAIADGIRRTAPAAAHYWEQQAHQALDRRQPADAWRMFMRVMEILPNDQSAPFLIRRLEEEHPAEVDAARRQWLIAGVGAPIEPVQTAMHTVMTEDLQAKAAVGVKPSNRTTPPQPKPPPPNNTPKAPVKAETQPSAPKQRKAQEQSDPGSSFPIECTLSRDDARYKKSVQIIDGLRIELKDTDPSPDADIDVYQGARRIRKVKDLRIGQMLPVQGKSGRRYYLLITDITDDTETITFGIRPADS